MKRTNIIFSIITMAFGAFVIFLTRSWPQSRNGVPGPAVFPRIIAAIIIACSAIALIRSLISKEEDINKVDYSSKDAIGVYITMGGLIVYIILLKYLGFIIDTIIMLSCFFAWFSKKKIVTCLLLSTISSIVIYVIFSKALNVSMRFGLLYF